MDKSGIMHMPEFYDRYINLIDDMSLYEALRKFGHNMFMRESDKLEKLKEKVYSENKWTVKEIIKHLIDSERIFIYRALRFARNDKTALSGFDENKYVPESNANNRTIKNLLSEFESVRLSCISLFESFTEGMLQSEGKSNGKSISVLAIGFAIAGHSLHHKNTINERYYPLLD